MTGPHPTDPAVRDRAPETLVLKSECASPKADFTGALGTTPGTLVSTLLQGTYHTSAFQFPLVKAFTSRTPHGDV